MRIDLVVPNHASFGPDAIMSAPDLEEMGYDGLWFTDHVVGYEFFKPVYGSYWLEVLTAMTHAAAITERVRIGAGVLVLPYRDPVYAAKVLTTIDVLSGGRVDLGVGTGWCRAEFQGLGRGHAFERRGAYTDEALEVMRLCWACDCDEELAFEGEFSNFRKLRFNPVPMQGSHIPLWIGSRGHGRAPLRRAAKHADVWHPTGLDPDELKKGSGKLDEIAGRHVPVSARLRKAERGTAELAEAVAAYADAGCIQIAMDLQSKTLPDFMSDAAESLAPVPPLQGPA